MEMAPESFNDYYEPFVGGGAVLFSLKHNSSHINDINTHLIHSYRTIRDNPDSLMEKLDEYDSILLNENKYKEMRELYNQHIIEEKYDISTAALFIYLNKHAFNSLFRVNKKVYLMCHGTKKNMLLPIIKKILSRFLNFTVCYNYKY